MVVISEAMFDADTAKAYGSTMNMTEMFVSIHDFFGDWLLGITVSRQGANAAEITRRTDQCLAGRGLRCDAHTL